MEIHITIPGAPVTKKNSQRIVRIGNVPRILPSAKYKEYEKGAITMIRENMPEALLSKPMNVRCVYYMPTRRQVDLVNLIEATNDILVRAGVLMDDHSGIVVSHDGSRVLYDKENPRAEVTLTDVTE